jgi:iron complex transport system substrate-binding protein
MRRIFFVLVVALSFTVNARSDDQGIPKSPRRIVSLAPSVTETLFALGAGDLLVGICSFCDFPQDVERITRVGSYAMPNVEAIIAQSPDVVIGVPPNSPEVIAALQRTGLKVVIVQVDTIAQIENAIRTIAREAGRASEGEQLLVTMRQQIAAIQARLSGAPQRRVLMLVGQNPLIAVGSDIFLNELISLAHGVNIATATGQQWPHLSLEFAIANQPEVIIDGSMGSEEKDKEQRLGVWRNFPALPAVKEKRVYGRHSYSLLRPGPRLAEAFEEIARFIHPERFP